MEFDKELELELFLFVSRRCRKCLRTCDLIDGFYHTRKDRGHTPSAYAYECKECTVKRVSRRRKKKVKEGEYPDW